MTGEIVRLTPRFAILVADDGEEFFFSASYHAADFDHSGFDFDRLRVGQRVLFEIGVMPSSGRRRLARHVRPLDKPCGSSVRECD